MHFKLTEDSKEIINKYLKKFPLIGLANIEEGDIHLFPTYKKPYVLKESLKDGSSSYFHFKDLDDLGNGKIELLENFQPKYASLGEGYFEFLPRIHAVYDENGLLLDDQGGSAHEVLKKYISEKGHDSENFAGFALENDLNGEAKYIRSSRSMNKKLFKSKYIPNEYMKDIENTIEEYLFLTTQLEQIEAEGLTDEEKGQILNKRNKKGINCIDIALKNLSNKHLEFLLDTTLKLGLSEEDKSNILIGKDIKKDSQIMSAFEKGKTETVEILTNAILDSSLSEKTKQKLLESKISKGNTIFHLCTPSEHALKNIFLHKNKVIKEPFKKYIMEKNDKEDNILDLAYRNGTDHVFIQRTLFFYEYQKTEGIFTYNSLSENNLNREIFDYIKDNPSSRAGHAFEKQLSLLVDNNFNTLDTSVLPRSIFQEALETYYNSSNYQNMDNKLF